MTINFPLILVLATFVTGAIWLVDILILRPRRRAAAENIKQGMQEDDDRARVAVEATLKESTVVEYAISFFPVLLIVLVLRSFLVEPFQIPTGSMIPTLEVGDFILVNKYEYGIRLPVVGTEIVELGEPQNGDVMVFIPPHTDEYFIKRVIGIPGDRVRYENKTLYINGEEQKQNMIARVPPSSPRYLVYEENLMGVDHRIHKSPRADLQAREWDVPEGHYFMMGDNRDQSSDSRYWGMVPEQNIVGKAFAIWFHKDPGWRLPEFSRNGWIQ
ncbi:MAG: signal peptidase I [Pseudomonadales bacterium]